MKTVLIGSDIEPFLFGTQSQEQDEIGYNVDFYIISQGGRYYIISVESEIPVDTGNWGYRDYRVYSIPKIDPNTLHTELQYKDKE